MIIEYGIHYHILESSLHPEPLRNEFHWVVQASVMLELKMDPSARGEPLRIVSRHFRPQNNDIVVEFVRGSVPGEVVEVPTYAAVDARALRIELERLAKCYGYGFLHELATSGTSEIVRRTLQEAFQYAVSPFITPPFFLHLCLLLDADSIHKRRNIR